MLQVRHRYKLNHDPGSLGRDSEGSGLALAPLSLPLLPEPFLTPKRPALIESGHEDRVVVTHRTHDAFDHRHLLILRLVNRWRRFDFLARFFFRSSGDTGSNRRIC